VEDRDDPLDELALELRAAVEDELLADAEAVEELAELGRRRARSVSDLLTDAMHRGDAVRARSAGFVLAGSIAYVGNDYVVIEGMDATADVRMRGSAFTLERARAGGHRTTGGSRTFRARLAEYEQSGEPVVLHTAAGELRGVIDTAATDHVVVRDDMVHVVPYETISLVLRPRPSR
jgi:hypothetical protein